MFTLSELNSFKNHIMERFLSFKKFRSILFVYFAFFPALSADTLFLKDKTVMIGRVIDYEEDGIKFETGNGIFEVSSDKIQNIEVGFTGIKTNLKIKSFVQDFTLLLIQSNPEGLFTFYDELQSKILYIDFKEIVWIEYHIPEKIKNFLPVSGGYDVEVVMKDGQTKKGILSSLKPESTILIDETSGKLSISNRLISKVIYQIINDEIQTINEDTKSYSDPIRFYDYLIPGLHQIRTGRKRYGSALLMMTVISLITAEYEYERGRQEIQKQKLYNEQNLFLGGEYGFTNIDTSYESYYDHKDNNHSLLLLTSVFYALNLFDLWRWRSDSKSQSEIGISFVPLISFSSTSGRSLSNLETAAQVRFQWKF